MNELAQKLYSGDVIYAKAVVAAFHDGMSCLIKTNCHELKPVKDDSGFHFVLPHHAGHQISFRCDVHLDLQSVTISTNWGNLQKPSELKVTFIPGNVVDSVYVNHVLIEDHSWLLPSPVVRACLQIINDLELHHHHEFVAKNLINPGNIVDHDK